MSILSKQTGIRLAVFAAALLSSAAVGLQYHIAEGKMRIILLLVFLAVFAVYTASMKHITARRAIVSGVMSLIFGAFLRASIVFDRYDGMVYSIAEIIRFLAGTVGIGLFLFPFFVLLYSFLDRRGKSEFRLPEKLKQGPLLFFCLWVLFVLSFVPALLAYWPGIFAYDFTTQMNQAASGAMSEHHPILHTLLCFFLLNIGKSGTDCTVGALCCSLFQMLALGASFAYSIFFLIRRGADKILTVFAFLFLMLFPVNALFSINATKDVLFAAVFLPLTLFTYDFGRDPALFFKKPLLIIRFIGTVCLMSLLRNTGLYIILAFFVCTLIVMKHFRVRILLLCVAALVPCFLLSSFLGLVTDAAPGSSVEALAMPIEQIARSYRDKQDRFSEKDLDTLYSLIPEEKLHAYNSRIADPVKNNIQWNTGDAIRFVGLWAKMLPKCFGAYVNAFVSLNYGYINPDHALPDPATWHAYIETKNKVINKDYVITSTDYCPAANGYYQSVASGSAFSKCPFLSFLFRPAAASFGFLLLLSICIYRRRRGSFPVLCLLTCFWLLLFLSPIVLLRYIYPLIIVLPAMVSLLLSPEKDCISHERTYK